MTDTRIRTHDDMLKAVAFILDHAARHGVTLCSVSANDYSGVSAQVLGYKREAEAQREVDLLADALSLPPDDGKTANYDRRGAVDIGGTTVGVALYTGREGDSD